MRDPRTLIFIFLMPILQLVLLGYVNNTEIRTCRPWSSTRTTAPPAAQLLDSFKATDYFLPSTLSSTARTEVVPGDRRAARPRWASSSRPTTAITSPPHETAACWCCSTGRTRPWPAQSCRRRSWRGRRTGPVCAPSNWPCKGDRPAAAPHRWMCARACCITPICLSSYNIVPGLIAIILFQTATSLTALAIVRERERGTIEQLIVTPIRSWELVVGQDHPLHPGVICAIPS